MTKLQEERRKRAWSQTDLAARAKRMSAADISKFETGRAIPYPAQAQRIAKALRLTVDELLEPVDEPGA